MKISLGSDHGGYELKEAIKRHLASAGHQVIDFGCAGTDPVDYPDYGERAARAVATGEVERGILVCKSGIGMSMVGNKIPGVRAALCMDEGMAESSRRHNDANVLALSGGRTAPPQALAIVDRWLAAPFEGGRHARRVDKMTCIEKR
ncbi:MAG: ribose 5-phosphate isomerase B [Chlamydiota bacterium]